MSERKKVGRSVVLGRYIAKAINQFSTPEFQEAVKNPSYIQIIKKIMDVPFEPRKQGGPNPKQNKSELEKIPFDEFNIANPRHYAALLRERGHIRYNASNANKVRESLLENL